ncbi:MAG: hypothetical protein ACLFQV_07640, partial [Vulcanimicrobiota bacterium]
GWLVSQERGEISVNLNGEQYVYPFQKGRLRHTHQVLSKPIYLASVSDWIFAGEKKLHCKQHVFPFLMGFPNSKLGERYIPHS